MNKAAGPKLAAAVTNAGGLGVIGGVGFTPRILKLTIKHLKKGLNDPNAPFGVDLLLPKVGEGARSLKALFFPNRFHLTNTCTQKDQLRLHQGQIGQTDRYYH